MENPEPKGLFPTNPYPKRNLFKRLVVGLVAIAVVLGFILYVSFWMGAVEDDFNGRNDVLANMVFKTQAAILQLSERVAFLEGQMGQTPTEGVNLDA